MSSETLFPVWWFIYEAKFLMIQKLIQGSNNYINVWLLMLLSCIEIAIVVITWWKSMLESIESLLPLSGSLVCCCSRSSSRDRRLKSGKTWFLMKVMLWMWRILMLVTSWTFGWKSRRSLKGKLCHNYEVFVKPSKIIQIYQLFKLQIDF